MAAKQDPVSGLNYGWALGEDGWNSGMDANLIKLGCTMQLTIQGVVNTPSVTTNGTVYAVGTSPTGDFAGHAGAIAVRVEGAWTFFTPANGWRAFNLATGTMYRFTGTAWISTLAVTADAQAATSAILSATPAGVREFMEQYGFTASYMNTPTDLNSVTGTTDRTVIFAFSSGTLNIPVSGQYGRGIQFAGGGNYTTQIVWINGSIDSYIRFNNGGTWSSWKKTGYNDNDLTSTAWTAMTLQNSWTVYSGNRAVYRKVFGRIEVWLSIVAGTLTDGTIVATLPAGYRPPYEVGFIGLRTGGSSSSPGTLVIGTDGTMKIYNMTGATRFAWFGEFSLQ